MQYLRRAVKYFFYYLIILIIILVALVALKIVEADISVMFRNGYDSLWQIGLMLVFFGGIYPFFGFWKRETVVPGEYSEIRDKVVSYMESRGYVLETEEGENLTFRQRNPVNKALRMYEDRVTLTRSYAGFTMEGLRKDITRLATGMEYRLRNEDIQ